MRRSGRWCGCERSLGERWLGVAMVLWCSGDWIQGEAGLELVIMAIPEIMESSLVKWDCNYIELRYTRSL